MKRWTIWFASMGLAVALTGCGNNDSSTSGSTGTPAENAASSVAGAVDTVATTTNVKTALAADNRVVASNINVDTADKKITLKGKARSEDEKKVAEEIAKSKAPEGFTVVNELVVDPSAPNGPVDAAGQAVSGAANTAGTAASNAANNAATAASDTGMTAKVKNAIAMDAKTKGSNINVDVKNGAVTLNGTAASADQKSYVEQLVKKQQGVKSVTNNLTVAAAGAHSGSGSSHSGTGH